jgi:hypothetical protein
VPANFLTRSLFNAPSKAICNLGAPTKMVWSSSAVSTKFSVILHAHDKHNSAAYKVHLVADITSKLGCARQIF